MKTRSIGTGEESMLNLSGRVKDRDHKVDVWCDVHGCGSARRRGLGRRVRCRI